VLDYSDLNLEDNLTLFSDTTTTDINTSKTNNLGNHDNEVELDSTDSTYELGKFALHNHNTNQNPLLGFNAAHTRALPYTQVLNAFRANLTELISSNDVNELNRWSNHIQLNSSNDTRTSNPLKLRSTAKNAVVTFNALQKVFRPRFDEGRSNVRFSDLANSSVRYPIISENRVSYERLLGKNRENFFSAINYKTLINPVYSNLESLSRSNSIFFDNLPFLLSMQSDASRYMWFD